MTFHFRAAAAPLSRAVRAFWSFEGPGGGEERIVPDGCAEIVLHFGDAFSERAGRGFAVQPRALFAGQLSAPLWIRAGAHADVFGIRFEPAGARRLGLPPQGLLADARYAVEDLLPRGVRPVWRETVERMQSAPGFAERARLAEEFLLRTLARSPPDATEACVEHIVRHGGTIDLARSARHGGLSPRQMQRRFLADVGVTPKLFARIVRFQLAFERWNAGAPNWAQVAAASGYCDQPHLLRDFRQFAGDPPAAFVAALEPLGEALVTAR